MRSVSEEPIAFTVSHPALTPDVSVLNNLVLRICEAEGFSIKSLSIVLTDHGTVRRLNRLHLDHDFNTDVLSFPLGEEARVVDGEVYIDLDTAQERHDEFGCTFEQEVARYVVHGLLHLMGYGDKEPGERGKMKAKEDYYLGMR